MNIEELRQKTSDELSNMIIDLKKQSFNLRIQKKIGELKEIFKLRNIRRDVARIMTVLSERKQ